MRLAVEAGEDYQEICGVIVDSDYLLRLVHIRNASRRRGHSEIKLSDYQKVVKAARRLGYEVIGSFHSHPISDAKPGYSDCRAGAAGRLLLIIDCIGREARLWRIMRNRRAYPLRFKEV
jgi:proteasome lid subunit RPN8/RPN11